MEHPPIYTLSDVDLAYLNPRVKPDDPRRYRAANRLRATVFDTVPIAKRGRRGQRYWRCHLREPPLRNPVRRYYEETAQNVQGRAVEGCTPIDRFLIATLDKRQTSLTDDEEIAILTSLADDEERLVIPLQVFEDYVATNEKLSSLDDLFAELRDDLCLQATSAAAAHRKSMLRMMGCHQNLYLASPPRPPRLSRPTPPTPPTPPPAANVFRSELGHECARPRALRKAPSPESQKVQQSVRRVRSSSAFTRVSVCS